MIPCRMNPLGSGWPKEGSFGVFLTSSGTAVSSAIVMSGAVVSGPDHVQTVYSHGTARETVLSGGTMFVSSGGSAAYTQIRDGGTMSVHSGHADFTSMFAGYLIMSDTIIEDVAIPNPSSYLAVYSGGTAIRTNITGGWNGVYSGGITISATLNSGGRQNVSAGGVTTASIIKANGRQNVSSGGTAYSTTVSSGGSLVVVSGGTALSVTSKTGAVINSAAGAYITYA